LDLISFTLQETDDFVIIIFLYADNAMGSDILHVIMIEIYYKRIYLIHKYGWKIGN